MTSSGAIMPRARGIAHDATIEIPELAAQLGFADPFDLLVERMRPVAVRSVDALQVAASLEASGVTDRSAKVEFGYADVFDLAEEICRRVGTATDPPRPAAARRWAVELRDIAHGALYLLPAGTFPAAFAALGARALVLGVVLAAAIGWIWSGATAWLAYRLLGDGTPGSAARLLRWSSFAVLPVAAAATGVVASTTGAGAGLVAMAVAQVAYQMAATTLVFYHREGLMFASMTPAVAAGIGYLVAGPSLLPMAIVASVASVGLAYGLAVGQTFGRGGGGEPPLAEALRAQVRPFPAVLVFTALSAVFFLYPQGRHMQDGLDVAIAVLPVIVGMGVVEWRAHRFCDESRALLHRVRHPKQFVVRIWLLVLSGLGICVVAVSTLAAVLLAALSRAGQLSTAGTVLAAAGVLLAGAYYLGFLLANMARYAWLCGSLMLCLGVYFVGGSTAAGGALTDATALLAATGLLLLLYLVALAGCVGQAHRHR
jgi:hypothetical protein